MSVCALLAMPAVAAATAFTSVVQTDSRWMLRTGDGRLWRARGVEKVNGYGPDCGPLGRPYAAALAQAGLSRDAWCARTAGRLKEWGFNLLGTACDSRLNAGDSFATTEMIAISSWMRDRGPDHLIAVNPSSPCGPVANAFHPDFAAVCDKAAEACCRPHRGERNFLGYFLDNELNWWGTGAWWTCGLLDAALEKLPASHPAHAAAVRILAAAPDRAAARVAYTEELARTYFGTIAAAIRRHDPDHLILGVRFAGVAGAPDPVWRICGAFCDVVSLNCYPNADPAAGTLSLDVAGPILPTGWKRTGDWTPVPLAAMLERRFAVAGRPLFISEWSFRGADAGRPRRESNGQELPVQADRARAIALFLREMDRLPYVVGHAFYKWTDDLFPSASGGGPETLNWGLVSLGDVPYVKAVQAFREEAK